MKMRTEITCPLELVASTCIKGKMEADHPYGATLGRTSLANWKGHRRGTAQEDDAGALKELTDLGFVEKKIL